MTASERHVVDALDAVVVRMRLAHALRAGAAGGAVAAVVSAIAVWRGPSILAAAAFGAILGVAVGGALFVRQRGRRTRAEAARHAERRAPAFRNVLITAAELIAHPARAAGWIRARVMDDSIRLLREHPHSTKVDLQRPAAVFAAAQVLWLAVVAGAPQLALSVVKEGRSVLASLAGSRSSAPAIRIVVDPPSYTGLQPRTLLNPQEVEAVEGSRVRVLLADGASRVRFGSTLLAIAGRLDDAAVFETVAKENGYLAIESDGMGERAGTQLIAVSVTPDRTPAIRVEQPGRDLLLPAAAADIDVRASATDDYGLQALELRYTKVSGTGEQFEFVEGALPVGVTRADARSWAVSGRFDLRALGLERGDSLVYRVVARDGRPGASAIGTSDTYFIEIAGPGQVALAGVDMPPEQDRYAPSQQMIVLKIERLRARETSIARVTMREEAETIAAEQRAVRANFIFLMGGHVEDEEEEAEQSHEIQEGRLENRARRDMAAAVRHMTAAERGLAAADTASALPPARAAVEALQRAFGHSRYILRTLPIRSRIDPARRLARAADIAGEQVRDARPSPERSSGGRARRMLASLMSIQLDTSAAAGPLGRLAEEAFAVVPPSAEWQAIARSLVRLGDAVRSGAPPGERRSLLEAVTAPLTRESRQDALAHATAIEAPTRLTSAWADRSRR